MFTIKENEMTAETIEISFYDFGGGSIDVYFGDDEPSGDYDAEKAEVWSTSTTVEASNEDYCLVQTDWCWKSGTTHSDYIVLDTDGDIIKTLESVEEWEEFLSDEMQ